MATSITDAVSLESIARTDPFSTGSMFKDPSAAAAAQVTNMSSKLDSISSLPGLDTSLQVQFTSLSSSMSNYTSGISSSFASRMGSFNKDMSTVAGEIDLFDVDSPCGIINSVMGTFSKIGDIIGDAVKGVKSVLQPMFDAVGDFFAPGGTLDGIVDKLHGAMSTISNAIGNAIDYMSNKLTEFTDMVSAELSSLGNMLGKLVDLDYLAGLRDLSICGQNVVDAVSA